MKIDVAYTLLKLADKYWEWSLALNNALEKTFSLFENDYITAGENIFVFSVLLSFLFDAHLGISLIVAVWEWGLSDMILNVLL